MEGSWYWGHVLEAINDPAMLVCEWAQPTQEIKNWDNKPHGTASKTTFPTGEMTTDYLRWENRIYYALLAALPRVSLESASNGIVCEESGSIITPAIPRNGCARCRNRMLGDGSTKVSRNADVTELVPPCAVRCRCTDTVFVACLRCMLRYYLHISREFNGIVLCPDTPSGICKVQCRSCAMYWDLSDITIICDAFGTPVDDTSNEEVYVRLFTLPRAPPSQDSDVHNT